MTQASDLDPEVRERLVRRFRRFADEEAPAVGSPLYARLAAGASRHPDVLAVLAEAPERQQRPTTLFAAVHDVLLRDPQHPLAAHYPRLAGDREPSSDPVDDLRDLVREHHDELRRLAGTRGTQTNEVLRAVGVAPAIAQVAAEVGRPVALLEVGPSAGLLLRLDRYGYRYVDLDGRAVGESPAGGLRLTSEVRHGDVPPVHLLPPPIVDRVGLDLAPLDVTDEDDVRWLRACVWPEHTGRAERLDAALAAARDDPPPLVTGDMVDDLAATADRLDPDAHLVVLHGVSLMYLPAGRRERFRQRLAELARRRPLDVVAFEDHRIEPYGELFPADLAGDDAMHGIVARSSYRAGEVTHTLLGRAHMHGRWVGWA
ncbi:MAG: DUF2332 domain-containing protein [Actinobacteria bacterium]|nr:DUF2332 domain-containing protein [Actinomycetota bacterium]